MRLPKVHVETVVYENLTTAESAARTRQAHVLLCYHGAGCTNLMWLQSPSVVIEIFPFNWRLDCYKALAEVCAVCAVLEGVR